MYRFLTSGKCTTQIFRFRFNGNDSIPKFLYNSNDRASGSVHCLISTCCPSTRLAMVLTTTCVLAILINSRHEIQLFFWHNWHWVVETTQ